MKKIVGLVIFAVLSFWAGSMMWYAAIEIAQGHEWLGPVSWLASSAICWTYWYRKVIR